MDYCRRIEDEGDGSTLVRLESPPTARIRCGARTSKGSSRRSTVTDHYSRNLLLCKGASLGEDGRCDGRISQALSRGWTSRSDANGQRRSVRIDGDSRTVRAQTSGGCSSASSINASPPRALKRTGCMNACTASSSARAHSRPPATSVVNSASSICSGRATTTRGRMTASKELSHARWEPPARPYPERIFPPEYPSHLEVRRVSTAGTSRTWVYTCVASRSCCSSQTCADLGVFLS